MAGTLEWRTTGKETNGGKKARWKREGHERRGRCWGCGSHDTGVAPRGRREEQQKRRWQQGNRETTREGGQERALGKHKNQLKFIEGHEGGRVMREEEHRPLSKGVREEENPTHTPPRRVSVECRHVT
jgi:hypothetical protein